MAFVPANIAEPSDNTVEPGRQRKRGPQLEQAIRDATVAELADGGYENLTIESVAARAQTGKASIYRRWPTKLDLVVHSVGCLLNGPLLAVADVQLDDAVSTRDALLRLVTQISGAMAGPSGEAMRTIIGESLRNEGVAATLDADFFAPRKDLLVQLLRRGVDRGEVRPEAVNGILSDLLAGTLIHRFLVRRQPVLKRELAYFIDTFVMPALTT